MDKWKNELENAADKLQTLGRKAVDSASEGIEKARPIIEDKIEDAKEIYRKAKPIIEDGLDKAVDSLRTAYEKARPAIEEGMDKAAQSAKVAYDRATEIFTDTATDAEFEPVQQETPLPPPTQEEQIELDVQAQLEKIQAAASAPNAISDFIKSKYGKKD